MPARLRQIDGEVAAEDALPVVEVERQHAGEAAVAHVAAARISGVSRNRGGIGVSINVAAASSSTAVTRSARSSPAGHDGASIPIT
ncbi:hypothetical protein NKG94_17150 [Micromonospora sp. M12]